jgi:hypothetical protein
MSDTTRLRTIDVERLEGDVISALTSYKNDKVIPMPKAEDIGRLSAEAVLSEYEAASKAVEELGDEIKSRIKNLEVSMFEADADLKLLAEAAAAIREKGKLVQVQIEEASSLSKSIKDACAEFHKKING